MLSIRAHEQTHASKRKDPFPSGVVGCFHKNSTLAPMSSILTMIGARARRALSHVKVSADHLEELGPFTALNMKKISATSPSTSS